jgi:hypothetical protein
MIFFKAAPGVEEGKNGRKPDDQQTLTRRLFAAQKSCREACRD